MVDACGHHHSAAESVFLSKIIEKHVFLKVPFMEHQFLHVVEMLDGSSWPWVQLTGYTQRSPLRSSKDLPLSRTGQKHRKNWCLATWPPPLCIGMWFSDQKSLKVWRKWRLCLRTPHIYSKLWHSSVTCLKTLDFYDQIVAYFWCIFAMVLRHAQFIVKMYDYWWFERRQDQYSMKSLINTSVWAHQQTTIKLGSFDTHNSL